MHRGHRRASWSSWFLRLTRSHIERPSHWKWLRFLRAKYRTVFFDDDWTTGWQCFLEDIDKSEDTDTVRGKAVAAESGWLYCEMHKTQSLLQWLLWSDGRTEWFSAVKVSRCNYLLTSSTTFWLFYTSHLMLLNIDIKLRLRIRLFDWVFTVQSIINCIGSN